MYQDFSPFLSLELNFSELDVRLCPDPTKELLTIKSDFSISYLIPAESIYKIIPRPHTGSPK